MNTTPIKVTSTFGTLCVDRQTGIVLRRTVEADPKCKDSCELREVVHFDLAELFRSFPNWGDRETIEEIDVLALYYTRFTLDGEIIKEEPALEWREETAESRAAHAAEKGLKAKPQPAAEITQHEAQALLATVKATTGNNTIDHPDGTSYVLDEIADQPKPKEQPTGEALELQQNESQFDNLAHEFLVELRSPVLDHAYYAYRNVLQAAIKAKHPNVDFGNF